MNLARFLALSAFLRGGNSGSGGGGNGGSGGAQPDWNAAEGEPGHVLNRTHYEDKGAETEILPEVSFSSASIGGGYDYSKTIAKNYDLVKAGDAVRVVWDGTVYDLVAREFSVSLMGIAVTGLGCGGIEAMYANAQGGSVDGEPFAVVFCDSYSGETGCHVASATEAGTGTHTVAISFAQCELKKIPEKYLPDIPFFDLAAMGLPAVPVDETNVSVEADCSAILAALSRGPVKFRVLANLEIEFTVEFVATGTTVVGAGTGVAAMMPNGGMDLVFCIVFANGTIFAYVKVLTTG